MGDKKNSDDYQRIMFIKDTVNIVLCEIEGERDLKIVHDKTRGEMWPKKDNNTASAFPWRYNGDAFRVHFNMIYNIHNMIESALMDTFCLSKCSIFRNVKQAIREINERLDMYFDVLLCLFWDAVFHRNLSHLNSKETLTLRELTSMILLGVD